ncbi:MAG: hypothetical protein SFX73_15640 [Kofleriaceae bacterium]|nr:hypothetical protein [Kofleriaceae bacterium]
MHVLGRSSFLIALVAACGKGTEPGPAATQGSSGSSAALGSSTADMRAQCLKVRDHIVDLLAEAYVANPATTFDGLDRSDPVIAEGLDLALTRDSFGAFLTTDAGKAWIARQKARSIGSPEMAATVDKCTREATQANIDCWLESMNVTAFQLCPMPGPTAPPAP